MKVHSFQISLLSLPMYITSHIHFPLWYTYCLSRLSTVWLHATFLFPLLNTTARPISLIIMLSDKGYLYHSCYWLSHSLNPTLNRSTAMYVSCTSFTHFWSNRIKSKQLIYREMFTMTIHSIFTGNSVSPIFHTFYLLSELFNTNFLKYNMTALTWLNLQNPVSIPFKPTTASHILCYFMQSSIHNLLHMHLLTHSEVCVGKTRQLPSKFFQIHLSSLILSSNIILWWASLDC